MKKKCFFGILLSLFLLCGGVFLLVSYKNDSVDVIDQSSAATSDTIYIQVNINGWYINNFKFGDNNAPLNDIKGFVALSNFLNITNGNAAYSFRGVNYASGKATTSAYAQADGTWKYRSWRWDNAEINSNVCESYSVTSFSSSGASLYTGTRDVNKWLLTKGYNHYDKSGTVTFILNITVVPKDFWVNINVLDPSGNETYNCGIFNLKDHNNAWTKDLNNEVDGKRIPFGASW